MACTQRANRELKLKMQEKLKNATDPIEKLRAACLSRGATGIKGLARTFRIMDDDESRSLDFKEFKKGIHDYGLTMLNDETIQEVFQTFDKDNSNSIDFDEFLVHLRPPMSNMRKNLIHRAFAKLDRSGDGIITVDDLKGVYSVKKHPKFLNGEWSEDQCLGEFLKTFDTQDKDGRITPEEFELYYQGVSASIDSDAYFDLMMRVAYKLDN